MDARLQDLPFDPGTLKGLSEKLTRSHHQNNYGGAVKRLNAIRSRLREFPFSSAPVFEVNGLKREELIATNSVLLHELYFDCLGAVVEPMTPAMELALQASRGSVERWREEFVAMGKALGGGEHWYHMDFGAAAAQYVDAFMENINWSRVYERYQAAVDAASEPFGAGHDEVAGAQLLDVRRLGMYEPRPCACVPPGWMPSSCAVASMAGNPQGVPWRPSPPEPRWRLS